MKSARQQGGSPLRSVLNLGRGSRRGFGCRPAGSGLPVVELRRLAQFRFGNHSLGAYAGGRVHKIVFQFGPLTLHWYGVLVAAGFLAGLWTASRRAVRAGIPGETLLDLGPWLILGVLVGARTFYVVSNWQDYFAAKPLWEIFAVHHGGLVFYGGLLGASLTVIFTRSEDGRAVEAFADVRSVMRWAGSAA